MRESATCSPRARATTSAKVDHTLAELTTLKRRVSNHRTELLASDVEVFSSSVDIVNNRVIVGVRGKNERRADEVKSLGDPIVVVDAELPRTDACEIDACPNLKGGLLITQGGRLPAGTECTSGYIARRWDTDPDEFVLITAGHCIANSVSEGDQWARYKPDETVKFGVELAHAWEVGSLADIGAIKIWTAHVPESKNKFLSKPSDGTTAAITGYETFSQQMPGDQVCRIGWGSWEYGPNSIYTARKCGLITLYDTDSDGTNDKNSESCVPDGRCRYIKDMKGVNFDSVGGDSGGIVFERNNPASDPTDLFGTHVHSLKMTFTTEGDEDDVRGWYSTTTKGFSELQARGIYITPCQSSSC